MIKLFCLISLALSLGACSSAPNQTAPQPAGLTEESKTPENKESGSTAPSENTPPTSVAKIELGTENSEDMGEDYDDGTDFQAPPAKNAKKLAPNMFKPGIFDWPVDQARLTRGFFLTPKKKRGRPHKGLDLAAPKGTSIFSAHDGIVIYAGRAFKGYGKLVMIEAKDGSFATLYAHLLKFIVKEGARVKKGQKIATMGRSGRATGVHLHFEIRGLGGPVDPLPFMPKN